MTVSALKTYQIAQSIKLHFQQERYDFTKYGLNRRRFNENAFRKRNDRYFFEKLGSKFDGEQTLSKFLAANHVFNADWWVGDLTERQECWENWQRYRKYNANLLYWLKEDTQKLLDNVGGFKVSFFENDDGQVPFVEMIVGGEINPETAVLYDRCLGIFSVINNTAGHVWNPVWNSLESRLVKFKPFVTIKDVEMLESCKSVVHKVLKENTSHTVT